MEELQLLDTLHLDAASGQYRDWGRHTEAVELQWVVSDGQNGQSERRLVRVVTNGLPPVLQLVPHFG